MDLWLKIVVKLD